MSATAVFEEQVQVSRERLPWAGSRGITLSQLLTRAHESVHAHGIADCPVCNRVMERAGGKAACATCGSRLS